MVINGGRIVMVTCLMKNEHGTEVVSLMEGGY